MHMAQGLGSTYGIWTRYLDFVYATVFLAFFINVFEQLIIDHIIK
jgi:hypothetical protein